MYAWCSQTIPVAYGGGMSCGMARGSRQQRARDRGIGCLQNTKKVQMHRPSASGLYRFNCFMGSVQWYRTRDKK